MNETILTPAVLDAVAEFKKADSRIAGAITSRTNSQRVQATVAFAIGHIIADAVAAESTDYVEQATGLNRAKVDRIARMGRITRGLLSTAVDIHDEEQVADLTKVWLKVSSSKGVPVAVIDRIGARSFGTVAGLKDAVDAATVAEVTLAKVLKALNKAATALQDFDLSVASEDDASAFDTAYDLIAAFANTRDAEEEQVA